MPIISSFKHLAPTLTPLYQLQEVTGVNVHTVSGIRWSFVSVYMFMLCLVCISCYFKMNILCYDWLKETGDFSFRVDK